MSTAGIHPVYCTWSWSPLTSTLDLSKFRCLRCHRIQYYGSVLIYIYGLLKSKSIHLEGNRRDPHYQVCCQFPFRVGVMDTAKANIFLLSVTSSRRHGLKSELGSKPQHLSNKMRSGYISNYHLNGWMNGWVLLFVVCTMKCLVVVYKLQPAKYSSFISSQRSLTIWV